jgi:hypothetical protein
MFELHPEKEAEEHIAESELKDRSLGTLLSETVAFPSGNQETFGHRPRPSQIINVDELDEGPVKFRKRLSEIEELTLNPGAERAVRIWYTPARIHEEDERACKLERRKFLIWLIVNDSEGLTKDKKARRMSAKVCTSLVKLSKKEIFLGDCNIGVKKVSMSVVFFFFFFSAFFAEWCCGH